MKTIILMSGKKNAGKDTVAKEIAKLTKNKYVGMMHFAEPIKHIIAKTLGITLEDIELMKNQGNWEHTINLEWKRPDGEGGFNDVGHNTDMRTILQRFGTEGMKSVFGEDVWVDLMIKNVEESDDNVILIPDWRFPNEYYKMYAENIDIIKGRIESPNQDNTQSHSSENSLDDIDIDYVIYNNGEDKSFIKDVEEMLKEENL